MNTPYALTRFEGPKTKSQYRIGPPVTDINHLCQILDHQALNGNRIFIRGRLVYATAINRMNFADVRELLKLRAIDEAIKES